VSIPTARALRIFVVVGEHSGDQLGFKLMRALRAATGGAVAFSGIGGAAMQAEGLQSLFPLTDIAVMGFLPVIAKLPTLLARIRETAAAITAAPPDALVIIDSPDFTHRVARRVREALPDLPIVDYVSPTVWAWRPGRARAMRAYVDCLLALLPFEPAAHQRLGGPPCFYVGHPLIERLAELRPNAEEAARRAGAPPLIVALPGSRRTIMRRLIDDFGGALALLAREFGAVDVVLPTMPHLAVEITERVANWPVAPRIVLGEKAKLAAFRGARAALAASGTVTLELALSGVPMVGAYKVSLIEEPLKYVVKAPSILLPNLILGERAIPEILQRECTPASLAAALAELVREGGPPASHRRDKTPPPRRAMRSSAISPASTR
jgi:lipid-A-disaccharide synthase